MSASLAALIVKQKLEEIPNEEEVEELRRSVKNQKISKIKGKAVEVGDNLPTTTKRAVALAKDKEPLG